MESTKNLGKRLLGGIQKSIQLMIERSKKLNEDIVVSRDGKVVLLKASEL
jgi:hypothetical protein